MNQRVGVNGRKIKPVPDDLNSQSTDMLREQWRKIFGHHPNKRISKELLIRAIAYDQQSQVLGALRPKIARELRRIAGEGTPPSNKISNGLAQAPTITAVPGTRMVREWRGRMHQVIVSEDGSYRWNGERYSSLSKIARTITGAHWSGPRFFGLRDAAPSPKSQ